MEAINTQNVQQLYQRRKLTEEELEYVLSGYDFKLSQNPEINNTNGRSIRETIKNQLRGQLIEVGPNSLEFMRVRIASRFVRARAHPGEAVGIIATNAVMQQTTQSVLNTFHRAGDKINALFGLEGIREIVNANRNRRFPRCIVHFRNKDMTLREVYDLQYRFVGVQLDTLVTNWDIITPDEANAPWKQTYLNIVGKTLPETEQVLRLRLDVNKLYRYRLQTQDVAAQIETGSPPEVRAVASPTWMGIVDVYPNNTVMRETMVTRGLVGEQLTATIFLANVIVPALRDMMVGGVSGIRGIIPRSERVWSAVQHYRPTYSPSDVAAEQNPARRAQMMRAWTLNLNRSWVSNVARAGTFIIGIARDKIIALLEATGVVFDPAFADSNDLWALHVIMPNDLKPNEHINNHIEQSRRAQELVEKHRISDIVAALDSILEQNVNIVDRTVVNVLLRGPEHKDRLKDIFGLLGMRVMDKVPETLTSFSVKVNADGIAPKQQAMTDLQSLSGPNYYRLGTYVFAETEGSNLRGLFTNPLVDKYYTYSNDFHETRDLLGIEAARMLIITDLYGIITNDGTYIDPAHVALIADFMTVLGIVTGVDFRGQSKQKKGPLSLASVQEQANTLVDAATTGASESTELATTGIITNTNPRFGTGMLSIRPDPSAEQRFRLTEESLQRAMDNVLAAVPITTSIPAVTLPPPPPPLVVTPATLVALAEQAPTISPSMTIPHLRPVVPQLVRNMPLTGNANLNVMVEADINAPVEEL